MEEKGELMEKNRIKDVVVEEQLGEEGEIKQF